DPYDQNASSPFFDPEWMFGIIDGFDLVVGNPPYIKEDVFRNAFDGARNSHCYQGKMDLWYLFGAKSIDILKVNGILCFIATNNWISNDGASKFRNKMIQEAIIKCYMDFGDYKVFSASIQTMVFVAIKNENPKTYIVKYGKLLDVNAETETLNSFLRNESNQTSKTYIKYPFNFKRANFKDNYINFIPSNLADVIQKIQMRGNSNIKDEEVFSGIDVMQDFVSRMHLQKLRPGYQVGQGIFVLSNEEKESITWNDQEKDIIRPYYTTREINRYYADVKNRYWILYTSVHVNNHVKSYPNIKKHLDQYQDIITSVNRPYGLHRTREECIFSGDKILSIRKCAVPAFSFVDFPCYVSRTFLIIKCPKINMKYLVSLLNSKIVAFWLWHKGKIQGNNYQIDKEPLLQIPLISTNQEDENKILSINNYIVSLRSKMADSSYFERLNNAIIYELYFPDEIKAANAEVLKHLHALPELKEDLSDEKKLKIIEKVYKELSDPQHPVSIALFKMDTIEEIRIIEGKQ
nr:Eco57I restriction-modification methylase domain-containing protein [Syntrophaceae bacterium]